MNYRACLESGYDTAWTFAHVPELLGCFSKERSREMALEKLPDRIQSHLSWLKTKGESVSLKGEITVMITEKFNCFMVGDYEVGACFEADRKPVGREESQAAIRRMSWNREELLSKVAHLPAEVLDKKLAGSARTLRQVLNHIAGAELWYIDRIKSNIPSFKSFPEEALARLSTVRDFVIAELLKLSEEELSKVVVKDHEEWTARKVLRRLLEHEREHLLLLDSFLQIS